MKIREDINDILPLTLIDTGFGDERFMLECTGCDTLRNGDLSGRFEVVYKSRGMDCRFECELTAEDIYLFFRELDNAWDIKYAKNSEAVLRSSYHSERSELRFVFDEKCKCHISGKFANRSDGYKSSISFETDVDLSVIPEILVGCDSLFQK